MALAGDLAGSLNRAVRRVPPWLIYLAGFGWSAWLLWEAASGALGADPVKGLERGLGKLGLQLLVAVLCVSPLRRYLGINLIRFRRALGLTAFYYITMHFVAWIVLDMGLLIAQALGDIVKRPYVTIGMAGLVLMIPLAVTSNDRMVRLLGAARWQSLQRLTYPAILLGSVHYIWQVKAWPLEPFLYLVAILALLALRFPANPRRAAS